METKESNTGESEYNDIKKLVASIFDNKNKSISVINDRSNNVTRNQLIMLTMIDSFPGDKPGDKIKSTDCDTEEEKPAEKQYNFFEKAYNCLKDANMTPFNVTKPFDYIAYMCFAFSNPE